MEGQASYGIAGVYDFGIKRPGKLGAAHELMAGSLQSLKPGDRNGSWMMDG